MGGGVLYFDGVIVADAELVSNGEINKFAVFTTVEFAGCLAASFFWVSTYSTHVAAKIPSGYSLASYPFRSSLAAFFSTAAKKAVREGLGTRLVISLSLFNTMLLNMYACGYSCRVLVSFHMIIYAKTVELTTYSTELAMLEYYR